MKGFAVLLCAIVAIQARSTGNNVQLKPASAAALGENPWVVHLRIAVSTSGLLESCVGTLYNDSWVLTTASCVEDARFIWIRYGAVDVIRPELVTETSAVRVHPGYDANTGENNVALVPINRVVETTDNIKPIALASSDSEVPSSGKVCMYGGVENVPGEQLICKEIELVASEIGVLIAEEQTTKFDLGAAVVADGTVHGILVGAGEISVFLQTAVYRDWIDYQIEESSATAVMFVDA